MKDKKQTKDVIGLYEKLLDVCKSDDKWINGWREPDKMRESLDKREKELKHWKKIYSERTDRKSNRKHINLKDE